MEENVGEPDYYVLRSDG